MKKIRYFNVLSACALTLIASAAFAAPWKFGVMSDTQWPTSPDGKNPNVSVNIIKHINQEMIGKGVKFVIQVGDLTDKPSSTPTTLNAENLDIRAAFAQPLYDNQIGFFPLRGNHEDKASSPAPIGIYAVEFQNIFPQTQGGLMNVTPAAAFAASNFALANNTASHPYLPNIYSAMLLPTTSTFSMGTNFATEPTMEGLTYSFDYDNARFVLADQFTKPNNTAHSNLDATDVAWIGNQFASRPAYTHGFSFAHKHLVSENHADNMFNSTNPTASTASKDLMATFMKRLQDNGVRYHMGGHDHMHNRAIISSPAGTVDGVSVAAGTYKVQNIIAASDSYKFYTPPYQTLFNSQLAFRDLEKPISQEIFTLGYYIFTVDGPKVTAEFYSMPSGCGGDCDQTYDVIPYEGNTPTSYNQPNGPGSTLGHLSPTTVTYNAPVPFTLHETFGYSLNGIEKVVYQGASYALTDNTDTAIANGETGYKVTTAAILSGTNGSTGKDYNLRPLTKTVNTGWAPASAGLASDIFTLWGMQDNVATKLTPVDNATTQYLDYEYVVPDTKHTDTYTLSLSYDPTGVTDAQIQSGNFGLVSKDDNGNWILSVTKNNGGTVSFVNGPWSAAYTLGTYGVDTATHTAWAVVNHSSDFAVASGASPSIPVQVGPSGTITTLTPVYTWNAVSGAVSYDLYTNINGVTSKINDITAATNCTTGGNCTFTSAQLPNGAIGYWSVKAGNPAGTSAYSATTQFAVKILPAIPAQVSPVGSISTDTPVYTWSQVSGATSYDLYTNINGVTSKINDISAAANCTTGGNCTFTSAQLPNGAIGYWSVKARNPAGTSAYSATTQFAVKILPAIPDQVSPVGSISTDSPVYTWSQVSGATSYDLYTNINGVASKINDISAAANCTTGGNCTFTSAQLPNGAIGYWSVKARNPAGTSAYSATTQFAVKILPAIPDQVSPVGSISTDSPVYTWSQVSGATSYDLYTNINGVASKINDISAAANCITGGNCTFTSAQLPNGAIGYWSVKARNPAGTSAYSATTQFAVKILPAIPDQVSPVGSISTDSPVYTWSQVSGATSYDLYTNINGVASKINDISAAANCITGGNCTFTSAQLPNGAIGYWSVKARNPAGTTAFSPTMQFAVKM